MSKTEYRIVSGEESEIHDEPHIEGRRLTVRFVHDRVEGRGLEPGTVADRHDLDVADVYQALAYYHDIRRKCRRWNVDVARRSSSTRMS
jgi:uncharacterized protein (DUF433 family)